MSNIKILPKDITAEYKEGANYKASIGDKGIFEQSKKNERFFVGDQWHGAKCGNERPLVRRNVIKRIGDYKISTVAAPSLAVNYSAEGIPNTIDFESEIGQVRQGMINGELPQGAPNDIEVNAITSALSDYFHTTAERIKFDKLKEEVLRNAYITGTGILFTYWDESIETGLYVDANKSHPIKGDICCEVLNVENVNFGEPNCDDVQKQPYIIIAQRRNLDDVKREARRNGQNASEIKPDDNNGGINAGDRGEKEPENSQRVTVYTKLYKEYNKDDKTHKVMAVRVTENAYVRKPWCLNLRNYPIAKFVWEKRSSCIYGDSEITYLIPNQIAINRALTSAVWGLIKTGMPIMLVNGDIVPQAITNDPGQIIKVFGGSEDVSGAISYVQPPNSTTQFQNIVSDLCQNTLSDSGANDAALGNMRPENATAIMQLQEAAKVPMQLVMNRFYDFVEDVARIWCDFWLNYYGNRKLKISDRNGTQYLTFVAERYKNLLFTARIDVGAATIYSEAIVVSSLEGLLKMQIITPLQYLERLPKNLIPDITGLIEELKSAQTVPTEGIQGGGGTGELTDQEILAMVQEQYPEQAQKFSQLPKEAQAQLLQNIRQNMQGNTATAESGTFETQEVGDI